MESKRQGGRREGAGRKPLSPRDATVRITVTLTRQDAELLRDIGDGNASKGIRKLLNEAR